MRGYRKFLAATTLGLLGLVLVIAVGLITTTGQRAALSLASRLATSENLTLTIGRLEGSLFDRASIAKISISDREGAWLVAEDIHLSWSLLSLLGGRVTVDEFRIAAINVLRKPLPSRSPQSSDNGSLPLLPIKLDDFQIEQLILGESLTGQAARLAIKGSADLQDYRKGLKAEFSAQRLDGLAASLNAKLTYHAATQELNVAVAASEAADGLIVNALKLDDRPTLSASLTGSGPLDTWRANWSISASDQPFVAGRILLDRTGKRHRLATDVTGYIQPLAPPALQDLLTGKLTAALIGHFTGLERFDASHISLATDTLTMKGSGGFVPASSYAYGEITAQISRQDRQQVTVFTGGNQTIRLRHLDLKLALPDTQSKRDITLNASLEELSHDKIGRSDLRISARFGQTHPSGPKLLSAGSLQLKINADDISAPTPGLQAAIGHNAQFEMSGRMTSGGALIEQFALTSGETRVTGAGKLSREQLALEADIAVDDLGRFAELYGQDFSGHAQAKVTSNISLSGPGVVVTIDGSGRDLRLGAGAVSKLIGRNVTLAGTLKQAGSDQIAIQGMRLKANNLNIVTEGQIGQEKINLQHELHIHDLSALHPTLQGAGKVLAKVDGTRKDLSSDVNVETSKVSWRDQPLSGLQASFRGRGPVSAHVGRFDLNGIVGTQRLVAQSNLVLNTAGGMTAEKLTVAVGRNQLTGSLSLAADEPPTGQLVLDAKHLSDLQQLIGEAINGSISGSIELLEQDRTPLAQFEIAAPSVTLGQRSLTSLRGSGKFRDYLSNLQANANVSVASLVGDGLSAKSISLRLAPTGSRVGVVASASINQANVSVQGSFKQSGNAVDIAVDQAAMKRAGLSVRLMAPAHLVVDDTGLSVRKLQLGTGSGAIRVNGHAGPKALDIKATFAKVPAGIANVFTPELGLSGIVNGSATVRGSPKDPLATISAAWLNASAAAMRSSNLPPVNIKLDSRYRKGVATSKVRVTGSDRLAMSLSGSARLEQAGPLNLTFKGDVPLSLANAVLAARATQFVGRANLSGTIGGTLNQPNIAARVTTANATLNDPASGLKLERLNGLLTATERGLEIKSLTGRSALGGTLALSGAAVRETNNSIRTRLNLELRQVKFNDRQLLAGEVDGKIAVSGSLDELAANGSIYVRRLDVSVPAATPRSLAVLDIKHVNVPKQLAKKPTRKQQQSNATQTTRVALNIVINAANRIFVKGRGVDAQLGGGLKVRGTSKAPVIEGGFAMERGRLEILGRRLDFRRGRIQFDGGTEPVLDMEAVTTADDATIVVLISGPASKPVFKFSSVPELPEDEVIARLLFNKGLVGLSPLQLVQLANEVNKIGGLSSGPGIVEQLKGSVGIDVLDVSTDKTGGATVSAGRYVNDKTFVGVKRGPDNKSGRVVIDHDFTKNFKARGEVGADGNSKVGVGLEWNY